MVWPGLAWPAVALPGLGTTFGQPPILTFSRRRVVVSAQLSVGTSVIQEISSGGAVALQA